MDQYDVVVVGAGLAGLETARNLAEAKLRVLLTDRKPRVDAAVHTTGIFVRRSLEDFPQTLTDDCLGPAIQRVQLYAPSGRSIDLRSPHVEFRVGRMGKLYATLLARAREAGVDWLPGHAFVGADPRAGGGPFPVRLEASGEPKAICARFLIGADGANSRVARQLQLSENRKWIVGLEEVYSSANPHAAPALHCFLDPDVAPGYIAWVAEDGEETHIGVGGCAARFNPRAALQRFREGAAAQVAGNCQSMREQRGGRIPVGGVLKRIACRHGLLVGDAAGAVSPLTAGGLDPCLRLSLLAAQVAAGYLETGEDAILHRYQGVRFRRRFRLRRWARTALEGIRSRWLAELSVRLLGCAPLRRLAERVFFGPGSFPLRDHELQPLPVAHPRSAG